MKFHERFDIEVGLDEARRRFVARCYNRMLMGFVYVSADRHKYEIAIATALGEFWDGQPIHNLITDDFFRYLQALEAINKVGTWGYGTDINALIEELLAASEVDLGIEWKDGQFQRKGAALLDEKLVNDHLNWLRRAGFETVLAPFQKGLLHFLQAHAKPAILSDVVTDMYESVEALAKLVTKKPEKDLSGNRELFIKAVGASEEYKTLLKDYIDYANRFRHAETEKKPRPSITEREVESFVYLTGIFIRLAMPT